QPPADGGAGRAAVGPAAGRHRRIRVPPLAGRRLVRDPAADRYRRVRAEPAPAAQTGRGPRLRPVRLHLRPAAALVDVRAAGHVRSGGLDAGARLRADRVGVDPGHGADRGRYAGAPPDVIVRRIAAMSAGKTTSPVASSSSALHQRCPIVVSFSICSMWSNDTSARPTRTAKNV